MLAGQPCSLLHAQLAIMHVDFGHQNLYEGRKVSVALASESFEVTAWACSAEGKRPGYGCIHLDEVIILLPSDGEGEGV